MSTKLKSKLTVVNEGDLVEAVRGEEMHRGRAVRSKLFATPRLFIASAANVEFLDVAESFGWTLTVIEPAAPAMPTVMLPTVVGAVISWDSPYRKHLSTLEKSGLWFHQNQAYTAAEMIDRIADTVIGDTTFTVLRPVAEVAAEVLAEVKERAIARTSDTITIRHFVMANIGAEMGVTS